MAEHRATGLVERAGGPDGLRRILERFYRKLAADPIVGFHFAGKDLDSIVDGQLAFLLKAFGAAPTFDGRHPRIAHRDLAPILRGHFDRRLVLLDQTLREEGVGEADREVWLAVERSMRSVVQRD